MLFRPVRPAGSVAPFAFLALLLAACSTGPGTDTRGAGAPLGEGSQAIQGGTVDATNLYKFNVGLCFGGRGNCRGTCSGTLITPNLVVSARHCVDSSPPEINCPDSFGGQQVSPASLFVTTNYQMAGQNNIGWHSVRSILRPSVNEVCGGDIVLLVLNEQIAAAEARPATPAVQSALWDRTRYSNSFQAIGFGNTSFDGNGSGTRRYRANVPVYCIPGSPNRGEACPKSFPENEFAGGDGVCPGDSGSGAIDTKSLAAGAPISLGVVVRTSNDDGTCKGSALTRLDKWRDFIVAGAKSASNNWTLYPEPSWTQLVPPPDIPPPPPPPASLKMGEECANTFDCETKKCRRSPEGVNVCTDDCSASKACPAGFDCINKSCFKPPAPEPEPSPAPAPSVPAAPSEGVVTTTTTSCSVSAAGAGVTDPTKPVPWRFLAAAGVFALVAARRRRSR